MATQKFTNFGNFLKMQAGMSTVTTQSNKVVSNEVKDNKALPEPSYRKKPKELFGCPCIPGKRLMGTVLSQGFALRVTKAEPHRLGRTFLPSPREPGVLPCSPRAGRPGAMKPGG